MLWQPWALLGFQAVAHGALAYLVLTGEWALLLVSFAVYFLTGCLGMTMTYHRLLSHRAWKAPRWFEYVGTLLGAYGLTGSPIAWVAIHREHHRFTDREGDPHSPKMEPWWKAQWFSMFAPVGIRYVADLLKSPFQRTVHDFYFVGHAAILTVGMALSPLWTAALYLAPAAILWNAGSAIVTLNHMHGYRSRETKDNSRNNLLTGYVVWGEGWHNHHHADPRNPRFGQRWWEIDVGWLLIRMLSRP